MRLQVPSAASQQARKSHGFTLAEVSIALAIVMMIFTAIILAYTQATYRAEWTGYSLAAESLATRQIEQARSARWDPATQSGQPNEIYNIPLLNSNLTAGGVYTGYTWTNLDLPSSGTNIMYGTNFVTIQPVTGTGSASNIMVRVDSVWKFRWRTTTRLYTNTIATYLAPDNKQPEDMF